MPYPLPNITLVNAHNHAIEFLAYFLPTTTSARQIDAHVRERFPHPWVYIHVDTSFVDIVTKTSIAGIVRDNQGNWLLGFHCFSYASNPLLAELLAISKGLQVASEANITHITLHSDSKQAIDLINAHEELFDDLYSEIVMDCRELHLYFQERRIIFTRRSDNQVADKLTNGCRNGFNSLNVIRHFPDPPNYCQDVVIEDYVRLFAMTS